MKTKMRKLKISLAIILVAVIMLCNSSFLYAKNVYADNIILPLIQNQSFEIEGGWDIEATDNSLDESKLSFPAENAYDGQRYFALSDGEYLVKTTDYIEIDGEDNYIFGIKYITSSLDNTCQVSVQTFDMENNLISIVSGEEMVAKLVDTWSDAQVYLSANDNVAKAKLVIKIKAVNGIVGLDYAYGNKDIVKTVFGASISLQEGTTSMRFTGRVDKAVYDSYSANSVSVGILLMPTGALSNVGEFTIRGVSDESGRAIIVDNWNNQDSALTDGYYEFVCTMTNMHAKEALTFFLSARAFMKIETGGEVKYIYSSFDVDSNSRSVKEVALRLKADTETYFKYDDVQRAIIDAYALGELPK